MHGRMTRSIMGAFTIAALAAGLAVITAIPGSATPPTGGASTTVLARGTYNGNVDFVTVVNTFPGTDPTTGAVSSSGWHSHPGETTVIVTSGAITLFKGSDPCHGRTFSAGQAFTEEPTQTYNGVNMGSDPVVVYVTFQKVPV